MYGFLFKCLNFAQNIIEEEKYLAVTRGMVSSQNATERFGTKKLSKLNF